MHNQIYTLYYNVIRGFMNIDVYFAWANSLMTRFQFGDPVVLLTTGLVVILCILFVLMFTMNRGGHRRNKSFDQDTRFSSQPNEAVFDDLVSSPYYADEETIGDTHEPTADIDDFKIFKRNTHSVSPQTHKDDNADATDVAADDSVNAHLSLIEKDMLKLRAEFEQGAISQDIYLDKTYSLYHQARTLAGHD